MRITGTLFFIFLLCQKIHAQPHAIVDNIDHFCSEMESHSTCQNEMTIDSSRSGTEAFVLKFYKSNINGKLTFIQFQLLKPSVLINYYYKDDTLVKVSGIDKSTELTLMPLIYFDGGKMIYTSQKSIDGDNSGKYFLKKSKVYLAYYQERNKSH